MSEPTTEAGPWDILRDSLSKAHTARDIDAALAAARPAIEAEARPSQPLTLDVERLQQAYLTVHELWVTTGFTPANSFWSRVAAEYERLSRP